MQSKFLITTILAFSLLAVACNNSNIGLSSDSGSLTIDTSKEVTVMVLSILPSSTGVCGDDIDLVLDVQGDSTYDLSQNLQSVLFGDEQAVILAVDEEENIIRVRVPAQDPSGNFPNPSPVTINLNNANAPVFNGFTYAGNCDCTVAGASPDIVSIEDIFVATTLDFDIVGSNFHSDVAASMEGQPLDLLSVQPSLLQSATPEFLETLCSTPPCSLEVQVSNGNGCSDVATVSVVDNVIPVYQTYNASFQDDVQQQSGIYENYLGASVVSLDQGSFAMLSSRRAIKINPDKTVAWQVDLGDPLAGLLPGAYAEVPCYGVAQTGFIPSAELANGSDVDGDSIDDLIVFDRNYRTACVLSGSDGSLIFSVHDSVASLPTSIPGGDKGFTVAGLGDLNGDGKGEFMIASQFIGFNSVPQPGLVELYSLDSPGCSGASLPVHSGNCSPHVSYTGPGGALYYGVSVALAGDKIAIGASKESGSGEGAIYVYDPTTLYNFTGGGVPATDQKITAAAATTGFGSRLAAYNGDGLLALGQQDKAVIHVFADAGGSLQLDFELKGLEQISLRTNPSEQEPGFNSGGALHFADAGDIDRDGLNDIVVGDQTFESDLATPERGRVSVYARRTSDFEWILHLDAEDSPANDVSALGTSVAGVGDINADGFGELASGAPQMGLFPGGIGRTYLFNWLAEEVEQIVTP